MSVLSGAGSVLAPLPPCSLAMPVSIPDRVFLVLLLPRHHPTPLADTAAAVSHLCSIPVPPAPCPLHWPGDPRDTDLLSEATSTHSLHLSPWLCLALPLSTYLQVPPLLCYGSIRQQTFLSTSTAHTRSTHPVGGTVPPHQTCKLLQPVRWENSLCATFPQSPRIIALI